MPRKTFTAGEVLAAAAVNTFLMDQSVMTFADSDARDLAIPTPSEGMVTYLEDTDALEVFNGSSFVPASAGIRNPVDETNTAAGVDALNPSTSGTNLTAFGNKALQFNTTGINNTAIGTQALEELSEANSNTAVGRSALKANQASNNTAIGSLAAQNTTTGANNIALGQGALVDNTTGGTNVAVGVLALRVNTTGGNNVAVGQQALAAVETGIQNVAVGRNAGLLTTGNTNTFIGYQAGDALTTGSNNTVIGNNADAASETTSNSITLGNSSISSLRCQVTTISSLSDERDKKEIKDLKYGLDLINKVRPVEFTWNTRDGSIVDKQDIGFIAQELKTVEDNLNDHDRLRLTLRDNEDKLEATPGRLLPIAIKAIQELSTQNAELLARLEKLEGK